MSVYKTPEYNAWNAIKGRCHNPDHPSYKDYGGRGIYMCEAWRRDFPAFLAHVGHRPSPRHEIERINNNAGYEPGNVRWATRAEQLRNTRRTNLVTAWGETLCLTDWVIRCNTVSWYTARARLMRGYLPEIAFTAPKGTLVTHKEKKKTKPRPLVEIDGVFHSLKKWTRIYNVSYIGVQKRIKRGMSVEAALNAKPTALFGSTISEQHKRAISMSRKEYWATKKAAKEQT